jgi:hypothetical protein
MEPTLLPPSACGFNRESCPIRTHFFRKVYLMLDLQTEWAALAVMRAVHSAPTRVLLLSHDLASAA